MNRENKNISIYVPSAEQLIVEVYARDLARSVDFYQALGFEVLSAAPDFVVRARENHRFFLEARSDLPAPHEQPQANLRIMVPDVDRSRMITQQLGAPVIKPLADRDYGLRDFTIANPDGFGLRFGTRLTP